MPSTASARCSKAEALRKRSLGQSGQRGARLWMKRWNLKILTQPTSQIWQFGSQEKRRAQNKWRRVGVRQARCSCSSGAKVQGIRIVSSCPWSPNLSDGDKVNTSKSPVFCEKLCEVPTCWTQLLDPGSRTFSGSGSSSFWSVKIRKSRPFAESPARSARKASLLFCAR